MNYLRRNNPRSGRVRGFTLIEVMISVALVLMLTYGIAQVFKMSSDTVSATQTISGQVRDYRAAVTTMLEDFRNCASDSPLFLISSQVAYDGPVGKGTFEKVNGQDTYRGFHAGFKNQLEEMTAPGRTTDFGFKDPAYMEVNGQPIPAQNGSVAGTIDFTRYTDRTPRMDRLSFFARGLYRRQTAGNAQFAGFSTATATEAYIWYGQTALPGLPPSGSIPARGTPYANNIYMTLPQNQYAQDRILGRIAILLKDFSTIPTKPTDERLDALLGQSLYTPSLDWDSQAWRSYSDLAATTMDQWRSKVSVGFANDPTGVFAKTWYRAMEDSAVDPRKMWWGNCQPVLQRPITSQGMSQTASCFIPHCTQFVVEYAGDYLAQDPATGNVIDAAFRVDNTGAPVGKTDGEIDYIIDKTFDPIGVKKIRWYGLPRDVNDDNVIDVNDVVPLADVLDYSNIPNLPAGTVAPWEKVLPFPSLKSLGGDYSKFRSPAFTPRGFKYVCAWRNDAPPMIRVLMKFDDPTGRLREGQWYEYVMSR